MTIKFLHIYIDYSALESMKLDANYLISLLSRYEKDRILNYQLVVSLRAKDSFFGERVRNYLK